MNYEMMYSRYLEELPEDIAACKNTGLRVVFGYTSDLDVIFNFEENAVNKLMTFCPEEHPAVRAEDGIASVEDLARVLAAYMIEGIGGQCDISEYEPVAWLNEHLEGIRGLGGTGAQGAAAFAAMGVPLLSHISDHSREVCEIMNYPGLDTVRDGKAVPIMDIASDDTPVYHMIFQYTKGDTFRIGSSVYTVPCSNRLIMGFDKLHQDLHVDAGFCSYTESHADQLASYNISGLNAIFDPELIRKRLEDLRPHYTKIRKENPDCVFCFESAHYLNPKVKDVVYEYMSGFVDIMGMDEEELLVHTRECGEESDAGSAESIIHGLDLICRKYHVRGIILHTKDYSMYYGEELPGFNVEKGLVMGNLMACARAMAGRYASPEDCRKAMKDIPLSPEGIAFADRLNGTTGLDGRRIHLVPARYLEKPRCTIGLGDTFAAGVQLGMLRT